MRTLLATVIAILALTTVAFAQISVPECPEPAPGESTNVTFFPNQGDCHLYWQCDNGYLINGSCGEDLVWNTELNTCDWEWNAPEGTCGTLKHRLRRRVPSFKGPKPVPRPVKNPKAPFLSVDSHRQMTKKQLPLHRMKPSSIHHSSWKKQIPLHRSLPKKQIPFRRQQSKKTLPFRRPLTKGRSTVRRPASVKHQPQPNIIRLPPRH